MCRARRQGPSGRNGLDRWVLGAVLGLAASTALALPFDVRPIDFGDGVVATGTIFTAGSSSNIDDWSLTVTTTTQLARFTPANTGLKLVSMVTVSADGQALSVATSPDSAAGRDGGILGFRSRSPFIDLGAFLADFTGANAGGGQAAFMAGGAFDSMNLGQRDQAHYVAATATAGRPDAFDLVPLAFGNGVTMRGSLRTSGATGDVGSNDIVAWDIVVEQVTHDVFDRTNSTLQANLVGLSPDGRTLTLDNPKGFLSFSKAAAGGHPHALQLADFSRESYFYNQAGYLLGRQAVYSVDLHAPRGPWAISGDEPISAVPEPSVRQLMLLTLAIVVIGRACRRTRSATSPPRGRP